MPYEIILGKHREKNVIFFKITNDIPFLTEIKNCVGRNWSTTPKMWYLPNIIQGYLTTGSLAGVVLVIVLFIVSWFIWLPFFKVYEKQQYLEENSKK